MYDVPFGGTGMCDRGGGVKIGQNSATYFMDGPLLHILSILVGHVIFRFGSREESRLVQSSVFHFYFFVERGRQTLQSNSTGRTWPDKPPGSATDRVRE